MLTTGSCCSRVFGSYLTNLCSRLGVACVPLRKRRCRLFPRLQVTDERLSPVAGSPNPNRSRFPVAVSDRRLEGYAARVTAALPARWCDLSQAG